MLKHELAGMPALLAALATAAGEYRYDRKLLVCRRMGVGRELLHALAVRGVSWIGYEVTTPRLLAHELVAAQLAVDGVAVMDEFDELAILDEAMDEVLHGASGGFAELAEGTGLRQAVARSIRTLRRAGITAAQVDATRFRDEEKRGQVAGILRAYESRLAAGGRVDQAGVTTRAIEALAATGGAGAAVAVAARLAASRVYLLPDHAVTGLDGRLLALLAARGAVLLPEDPVFGMPRPASRPGTVPVSPAAAHGMGASPLSWLHDVDGWTGTARAAAATQQHGREDSMTGDVVLDVFAAASVSAELREVLRRVLAAGLRWDEVEIVTTDAAAYGVALDGLTRLLQLPVTYAAGLPVARTRPGRAVMKYLEWVQRGMPDALLRQMLERGDVPVPGGVVSGMALGRRLRSLRIGRGRARYEEALRRLEEAAPAHYEAGTGGEAAGAAGEPAAGGAGGPAPGGAGGPAPGGAGEPMAGGAGEPAAGEPTAGGAGEPAARGAREPIELRALTTLLRELLEATPALPDGRPAAAVRIAPGRLAAGALALLRRVAPADAADVAAKAHITGWLERAAQTLTRPAPLAGAVELLASRLGDAAPGSAAGGGPSNAAGGHLHLADLGSGGYTARRATFIVGLDSGRFPGSGGTDALLVDEDRRRLTRGQQPAVVPTAAERLDERRYELAALVARLRGRVTFSYAAWDAVDGRPLAPAAELLQAYRLISGDASADYEALHAAAAPVASAVPRGSHLLDGSDVWLHRLAGGGARPGAAADGALLHGVAAVCDVYPQLAAGVLAWKTRRRSGEPTPHHGAIVARAAHDPRNDPPRVVSATQLQTLGACPQRYLLRYVLKLTRPADAELPPDQWLSAAERGSLLHRLFERALRDGAARGIDADSSEFARLTLAILHEEAHRLLEEQPPPGAAVFGLELERLREDARAFIAMIREDRRPWAALELKFGQDGAEPVEIMLPDGTALQVAGAIDRVDELEDGGLVVVDYKTGSNAGHGGRSGAYDGGRRLQHVLYAAVAERLLDGPVRRVEYHFPTRRSENHRVSYGAHELRDGRGVIAELLGMAAAGWYIPTNSTDDCRHCDYAAVCRARTDDYGRVDSPLAEWSREARGEAPDLLRRLRR
jgi:hypothetical protein